MLYVRYNFLVKDTYQDRPDDEMDAKAGTRVGTRVRPKRVTLLSSGGATVSARQCVIINQGSSLKFWCSEFFLGFSYVGMTN